MLPTYCLEFRGRVVPFWRLVDWPTLPRLKPRQFFCRSRPASTDPLRWQRSPAAADKKVRSIYAVDDMPWVTALYADLLQAAGHTVRIFNHREQALEALSAERHRPSLLVTNYLGLTMPINQFLEACRELHPKVRILMASGFSRQEMRFTRVEPDHFIQKPFAPREFEYAVKAALACG
jgi:response regulator RpfG family c-di-GMP phosphodiesterase